MNLKTAIYRGRLAHDIGVPLKPKDIEAENVRLSSENRALSKQVEKLVAEVERQKQIKRKLAARVTLPDIVEAVAAFYQVSPFLIRSRKLLHEEAHARDIASAIAYEITNLSLRQIGKYFCNRDHATVHHGIKKIRRRRVADSDLDAEITMIVSWLEKGK